MTTIDLKDAAKFFGKKAQKDLKAAAMRGCLSAAARMVNIIVTRTIPGAQPYPPIGVRSAYKQAWQFGPMANGAYYENSVPYASLVEYGVRPGAARIGRAMIAALAQWAVAKGMAGKDNALQVAWALATSIKHRGIIGRAIMENANAELPMVLKEEVEREMSRAAGGL